MKERHGEDQRAGAAQHEAEESRVETSSEWEDDFCAEVDINRDARSV